MTTLSAPYAHLLDKLKASPFDQLAYKKVINHFSQIQEGRLIIKTPDNTVALGQEAKDTELVTTITVHNMAMFRQIIIGGMVAAAEMYMAGAWVCNDLLALTRLMCRNIDVLNGMDQKRSLPKKLAAKVIHLINQNTLKGSAKNISAHYDLSNTFFKTFLDPSMMYSSAIFESPEQGLHDASLNKLNTICEKLKLSKDDHLLEIGTGWGGMAVYAAKHYGCKVTTTTISEKQYSYTKALVTEEKLDHKITVIKKDYRELEGQYDKLVSIEMIEAVGHRFYESYFRTCSSLLKPHGLALIQAITISDGRYDAAKNEIDFIQRYIFPGGCLPSVSVIAGAVANFTDLQISHLQDITDSYAKTLYHWRQAFYAAKADILAEGFDEMFYRMWEYYLCYCEGGFEEHVIQTSQILMHKPKAHLMER